MQEEVNADHLLGKKVRDQVTGFEGIATAKLIFLYGCSQYGVTPEVKDGKLDDSHYFDEGRLEVVGPGIAPESVQVEKPGADHSMFPKIH